MDYSGTHLLADLFGCDGLDDIDRVESALRASVIAGGATLLEIRLHSFGTGQGITGVALLAESHISIHSWPERRYAAVDIFLCGRRHDLGAALAALVSGLGAESCTERRIGRGFSIDDGALAG